jgi:pyruvate decarboxylase
MVRCGQRTIIFLINNGGYTIEVEIHDGPYNVIKNWNYTALVDAIHNGQGNCWTTKVSIIPIPYIIGLYMQVRLNRVSNV